MNFSTVRSERITAIISTVVAVIILAAGVTAHQSHHAPVDDLVQLESDLRFQLEAGYRHDTDERATRLAQLEEVFQAWQQSPRLPADQELVATWLLEATIRSMPGSSEPMPTIPQFGQQPPAHPVDHPVDYPADRRPPRRVLSTNRRLRLAEAGADPSRPDLDSRCF